MRKKSHEYRKSEKKLKKKIDFPKLPVEYLIYMEIFPEYQIFVSEDTVIYLLRKNSINSI